MPASLPIGIDSVTKRYGDSYALRSVSLAIKAGEFLTLLGPSGSGKTTLLMVLAGFVRPDAGRVYFGEAQVTLAPPHKRNVGMVFQSYALFPHMSVLENVMYPLRLRKVQRAEAASRAELTLEMMQLGSYGARRVNQLSGGQQQRVALARAIVFEPPILLMDEPLSALDKNLRESMQIEIRQLHERVGTTTVYVTHDQREALGLSDRIAVLKDGVILQVDTPERIYNNPRNFFVADFVGNSYFLPVRVQGSEVMFREMPLKVPPLSAKADGPLFLVVRPEKLKILEKEPMGAYNVLEGTVGHRSFLGDSVELMIDLSSGDRISVRVHTRHELVNGIPEHGAKISLGLHPLDTVLVAGDDAAKLQPPMP